MKIKFTSFSALETIFDFCDGITMSLTPIDTPAIVEYLNPVYIIWSASNTTMVNGLSVLGWGVGGIEAEAGDRKSVV